MKFSAVAADGGSDGVVLTIDVFGVALPARLATSFAIQATDAGSVNAEGLALPPALPGSSSLDISAGVGRLPSILTIARDGYFKSEETEFVFGTTELVRTTLLPVLANYLDVVPSEAFAGAFSKCPTYNSGNVTMAAEAGI